MIAYHFVGTTLRDGRPVPPDGVWLEHDGPIAIRESGLQRQPVITRFACVTTTEGAY